MKKVNEDIRMKMRSSDDSSLSGYGGGAMKNRLSAKLEDANMMD